MSEFFCTKVTTSLGHPALMPAHQTDVEEINKLPKGQPVRVKVTRIRNVDHHRKYFALLNYAFNVWEPFSYCKKYNGQEPEKNFDRFRKDITILAGFYEPVFRYDGQLRLEPKSISFANMDQDEFEELYAKTVDVILKHVLTNYTGEDLARVMREIEEFE